MTDFITSPVFVDFVVIAIILFSSILAFIKGLTREIISLGVWIGSLILTFLFLPQAQAFLSRVISAPDLAPPIAAALVFLISFIFLGIGGHMLGLFIRALLPRLIDALGGFLIGLIRGVTIPCLLYLFLTWLVAAGGGKLIPSSVIQSRSFPIIKTITERGVVFFNRRQSVPQTGGFGS